MKTIIPKSNTFYVRKQMIDDIGVIPAFADAYVGLSETFDVKSNPDTSFYIAEGNTVSYDDFVYGDGDISEMYVSLYVSDITTENTQMASYLDVYNVKPNIDLIEGDMVITSGNAIYGGEPVLLYNSYNVDSPWMVEDFDGTNKDFMDMPQKPKMMIGMGKAPLLSIKMKHLLALMYETNRDPPENNKEWKWGETWSNVAEELGNAYDWTKYYAGASAANIVNYEGYGAGLLEPLASIISPGDVYDSADEEFFISKGSDGLYYASVTVDEKKTTRAKAFAKRLEPLAYPSQWWLDRGATWWADTPRIDRATSSFDQFDEDFVEKCTQFNSMFSNVMFSPDVRDIKDQSLEGPGDNKYFLSYTYCNIVQSDAPSNGKALRMKSFWENYSGSDSGAEAVATANPFGYSHSDAYLNRGAFQQTTSMTVYGIPQPTPIDISASGTGRPAYAPEIEIVMKVNNMDVTTYRASASADFDVGEPGAAGANTLDRSFSIWFNDNAPAGSDDQDGLSGGGLQLGTAAEYWTVGGLGHQFLDNGGRFAPAIVFINENTNDGFVNCYTNQNVFNTYLNYFFKRGDTLGSQAGSGVVNEEEYMVKVPIGEWFRMRIKLNMYSCTGQGSPLINASGGGSLVYFPDLMDENGQMKYAPLAHAGSWGENTWGPTSSGGNSGPLGQTLSGNNAHFPNMTLWVNNMRSINSVPTEIDYNHINNTYTKVDVLPDEDKVVDVMIDTISFNQWSPQITNATICVENGMGRMTKIPAGNFATPTFYAGDNTAPGYTGRISVHPTGSGSNPPDNYYAKSSALTASYVSFGLEDGPAWATASTEGGHHNFLLSNFSTGVEQTVDPIPTVNVSGGFMTAANYQGLFGEDFQDGWFNNLSAGGTNKNLHISGGAGSIDNFTQKGTLGVSGAFTDWVRTGNPLAGTKVISASDDGYTIVVSNPNVFDIPLNTPLCVDLNNATYPYKAAGSGSIGYYDVGPATKVGYGVPLVQTKRRRGNSIYLSRPIFFDDARCPAYGTYDFQWASVRGKAAYPQSLANTNFNLTKCTVSPYKYWFNIALLNASGAVWGDAFADTTHSGTTMLQARVYDGIVPVSGGTTVGTTYNEFLFNDGIYANRWGMNFASPSDNIVNLNTDYGYGSINSANPEEVPDSDGGVGRIGRDYMVTGQNFINIGSYAYTTNPSFNQPFNFLIKPTYMNMFEGLYSCKIGTKDETVDSRKLTVLYGIKDPLPTVEDFIVSPSIYTSGIEEPAKIAELTKSNATNINFEWKEQGDDINYRMLWVDTDLIQNKYHTATCIIPLNETVSSSAPTFYTSVANYQAGIGVVMDGDNMTPDIEGACGFGQKFDPNDNALVTFSGSPSTDVLRAQASYPDVAPNSTSGTGSGLKFDILVNATPFAGTAHFTLVSGGTGVHVGDTFTFVASQMGGAGASVVLTAVTVDNGPLGASGSTGTKRMSLGSDTAFTHCFHLKPSADGTFFSATGTVSGDPDPPSAAGDAIVYQYEISGGKVKMAVGTSGATAATLTSTTTYNLDGIQPLAVILTFDKLLAVNNFKLYVNGKLEDTEDYTSSLYFPSLGKFSCIIGGNCDSTNEFSGFVEEISFHSTAAYIPQNPNRYTLSTVHLLDMSYDGGLVDNKYQARLFLFDYHNIRGTSPRLVCRSNATSWKITGVT